MKVVGLVSPASQNSGRGIGFYVDNLTPYLITQAQEAGIEVRRLSSVSTDCDLIHYPFFDLFLPTLATKPGVKTVVTVHDVIPLQYPHIYRPGIKGVINYRLQKYRLNRVDHLITDSLASKEQIRRLVCPTRPEISVIHLAPADHFFRPVTTNQRNQLIKRFNLPEKFVLYVGDINFNKNLPTLFKACKLANLHLAIAGKAATNITSMDVSHSETAHIQELANHLQANTEVVSLLGFVTNTELSALYRSCAVYCQPSFSEGFGLTPLEAMACGTAVVSSSTPALTEVTGGNCLYFDPRSELDLAQKLQLAISAPRQIHGLIKKAKSHARKFSWDKTSRQTLTVYRHLLGV